jgi:hypothetical protein
LQQLLRSFWLWCQLRRQKGYFVIFFEKAI